MKFALLGVDDETIALAEAAIRAGHTIAAVDGVDRTTLANVAALVKDAKVGDGWDALLAETDVDAVIVARAAAGLQDARTDQLRTLIQSDMPMIVAHPVVDSMLVYYELDMTRQDTNCPIVPFAPATWHAATERLAAIVGQGDESPIGQVEQVVMERSMLQRGRSDVLAAFVRDVDMLRAICGDLNKLGAMSTSGAVEREDFVNLSVQMSGPAGMLVRWSVEPIEQFPGGKLTLTGSRGKAVLEMPANTLEWKLETRVGDRATAETWPDWNSADEGIDALTSAIAGRDPSPSWLDGCRDMELADAITRSLARGRTIDLYFDEQTEAGTFKGMMAAGGCLLLMLTLGVVIVATVLGEKRVLSFWPFALLAMLVIFLALQLLKLAFPPEKTP